MLWANQRIIQPMNKTLIAVIAVIVSGVFLAFRFLGNPEFDKKSLNHIEYRHQCLSCGAKFSYTTGEMRDFVRAGKFEEVPLQVRRFPCQKCSKISAVINVESPDAPPSR